MKHIKNYKMYEAVSDKKERFIYMLIDRSISDSLDKRMQKMSNIDEVYIFKIMGDVVHFMSTSFIYSSKISELINLESTLSRPNQHTKPSVQRIEDMIKFCKRTPGCVVKEYDTLEEVKQALEFSKHVTNNYELMDAHSDIKTFIKTLRPASEGQRKTSFRNHLLINNGSVYGCKHMIINERNINDFFFKSHYDGEISFDEKEESYYSANSFLIGSDYRNSYNKEYSLYHIGKADQTKLKNMVKYTRTLYVDFNKQIIENFKNPL